MILIQRGSESTEAGYLSKEYRGILVLLPNPIAVEGAMKDQFEALRNRLFQLH